MFALRKVQPVFDFRRMGPLLTVGAMSLLLGACAHNAGNAPGVQWQFNASDAGSTGPAMYAVDSTPLADDTIETSPIEAPRAEAAEHSAAAPACGQGDTSGWADNCYVYRGGRDPVTGRALTQL
jgi:hypothetical protein